MQGIFYSQNDFKTNPKYTSHLVGNLKPPAYKLIHLKIQFKKKIHFLIFYLVKREQPTKKPSANQSQTTGKTQESQQNLEGGHPVAFMGKRRYQFYITY